MAHLNTSDRTTPFPSPPQQETNLLPRFQTDVEVAGLVGERKNATILFLAAVSAKLQRPLNVTVQGASSAGKNHLLGTVASFIPNEMKKVVSGMTPKVLMHAEENEFKNKAIIIAEYEGVSKADYSIRTFQSEQMIEWEYVESSSKGIVKKTNRVRGPAAFLQATTRPVLHPENETRLLFVEMDESKELTHAIIRHQAVEAAIGGLPAPDNLFGWWHRLIQSLEPAKVVIPFAQQLAPHFPVERVRSRRDFPKLLCLIEASAFLHQHCRRKESGEVFASAQDYLIAKDLFEHCYNAGPDRRVAELVRAAALLHGAHKDFPVADLQANLGWGHTKTYEVLNRAKDLGCVADTETRGLYRFLHGLMESPLDLPETVSDD